MNNAISSPEPAPPEAHPALRLAELVRGLIAVLLGRAWLWCLVPGGRAAVRAIEGWLRAFAEVMERIAAMPPLAVADAPVSAGGAAWRGRVTGSGRRRGAASPRLAVYAEGPVDDEGARAVGTRIPGPRWHAVARLPAHRAALPAAPRGRRPALRGPPQPRVVGVALCRDLDPFRADTPRR